MKPTSNNPPALAKLLTELEAKLIKIEGQSSHNSTDENTQASSENTSDSPRLVQAQKSTLNKPVAVDVSAVPIDTHTPPLTRRVLAKSPRIQEKQVRRSKKSTDEDKSSSSTTPRSVRFETPGATTPLTPIISPINSASGRKLVALTMHQYTRNGKRERRKEEIRV
jgi:hypothetical protein